MNGKQVKRLRKVALAALGKVVPTDYNVKFHTKSTATGNFNVDGTPATVSINCSRVTLTATCTRKVVKQLKKNFKAINHVAKGTVHA
jgi:hypothetical protein